MSGRIRAARRDLLAAAILCLALALVFTFAVRAVRTAGVPANSSGDAAIKNQLLLAALDYVGTCDAEGAANVWAEGLRQRSAALQYAVMNSALREQYASDLEQTFPNWVTGVSSPWVDSYDIMKFTPIDETHAVAALAFTTATSTGIAGTYFATLTLEREGAFWRVTQIEADEELAVYTGFRTGT